MSECDTQGIKVGYARVSTDTQNLDLQYRALEDEGCAVIFSDKASGVLNTRKGLRRAIRHCKHGDVLVVWKLDRLSRSLIDLVGLVEELRGRGVGLRVLTGQGAMIDTTRPEGRMIFGIFASLAEFERELIRERTRAGMAAAKRRGIHCGRPPKLCSDKIESIRRAIEEGEEIAHIAAQMKVHHTTLRRALKKEPVVQKRLPKTGSG